MRSWSGIHGWLSGPDGPDGPAQDESLITCRTLLVSEPPPATDPASGVAILLSRRAADQVVCSGCVGSRIVWCRIAGVLCDQVIFGTYLPHKYRVAPAQDEMVHLLERTIKEVTRKSDCVVVIGDLNAKLPRGVEGRTGRYCLHRQADSGGQEVMDLMRSCDLFAASTARAPPARCKLGSATYVPKVAEWGATQIDYILVSNRWMSSVKGCKVAWGPSVHRFGYRWDHGLVQIGWKWRVRAVPAREPRLDLAALRQEEIQEQFNGVMADKWMEAAGAAVVSWEELDPINFSLGPSGDSSSSRSSSSNSSSSGSSASSSVEVAAAALSLDREFEVLHTTARETMEAVLPCIQRKRGKVRERSQRSVDLFLKRSSALQGLVKGSPEWWKVKSAFQKEITKSCREDYRSYMSGLVDEMKLAAERGQAKRVAELVKQVSGASRKFSSKQPSNGAGGELLGSVEALIAAWGEYARKKFAATGREGSRGALEDIGPPESRVGDVPTTEDLQECLDALSVCKATGFDRVPAEVYKLVPFARDRLFDLVRRIWREEAVPADLPQGEFVTIFKNKGSSDDMSKYRFICLLSHAYKMLSMYLLRRLLHATGGFLPETQAGFRKKRGTRDNVYMLAAVFDKALAAQQECVVTYIDFVAAFDTVSHVFLDEAIAAAVMVGEVDAADGHKCRAIFRAIYSKASATV